MTEQNQQKQWGFQKQSREAWPYAIKFDGGEDCVRCLTKADAERVITVLNVSVARVSTDRIKERLAYVSGMRDEVDRDLSSVLTIIKACADDARPNEWGAKVAQAATILEQYIKGGGAVTQPKDEVDKLFTERNMLIGDLNDILATVKCGRDAARNNEQMGAADKLLFLENYIQTKLKAASGRAES